MHPAVPYMERESTKDDAIPLRHPVIDRNGVSHSDLYVRAGQVILLSEAARAIDGY
jgi:hypothetical protein